MFISIGIPFYNAERYLESAIKSVLDQTYTQWELILLDDGSTDNSLNIANLYSKKDPRIRVISDGSNNKLPARLNQLIDESQYDYIARMDADDIMHPSRLQLQIEFLKENKNYDLVSTGVLSISSQNIIKGFRSVKKITSNVNIDTGFPIAHPTVMGKKSWFKRHYYSDLVPRSEDYELWCRASAKSDFKIAILPDLLLFYREENNLTASKLTDTYKDVLKTRIKYSEKSTAIEISKTILKCYVVKALFLLKIDNYLVSKRNTKLSDIENDTYNLILQQVLEKDY